MRKSNVMELNESIVGTTNHSTNTQSNKCLRYSIFILSNVASFMLGFYVKNKLFEVDENIICHDGSL